MLYLFRLLCCPLFPHGSWSEQFLAVTFKPTNSIIVSIYDGSYQALNFGRENGRGDEHRELNWVLRGPQEDTTSTSGRPDEEVGKLLVLLSWKTYSRLLRTWAALTKQSIPEIEFFFLSLKRTTMQRLFSTIRIFRVRCCPQIPSLYLTEFRVSVSPCISPLSPDIMKRFRVGQIVAILGFSLYHERPR